MQGATPEVPHLSGKYYFSTEALTSAYVNANLSQEIFDKQLDALAKEEIPNKADINYTSFNLNAVINSVMFIEATINEFYSEISEAKNDSLIVQHLGEQQVKRVNKFLKTNENFLQKENNLYKYDLALVLLDQNEFDKGRSPYQPAKILVDLRNFLIHYKIETVDILEDKASKLEASLKNKFGMHPLYKDNDITLKCFYPFPKNYLSHECAKWSIKTSREFVETFFAQINYTPYQYTVIKENYINNIDIFKNLKIKVKI
ncbi:MAG TPA: hypothetical protein VK184_23040 [Nostocaceae cyanobacterium]|nr:hypothetical protein [Nostocaceae cyanobacterium]